MQIRNLIQNLFASRQAIFHNSAGKVVPFERACSEYEAIRNYLLCEHPTGKIAALHLAYDYRYLLAIYACMEVGIPYLPLRLSWPKQRVEQIQALSGFDVLIDEQNIDAICAYSKKPTCELPPVSPEQPLYIIYTSGSTGEPKGVVIPRAAYEHFVNWVDAELPCAPQCRILFVADFTFDMSLLDIGLFLVKQGACYFSQFDSNVFRLASEIEKYRIESIATVPNNINMLLQDNLLERADFGSLKQLLLGGSRFAYGTYKAILAKMPQVERLYNFYGPTEVTVYCHYRRLTGQEPREVIDANVSIGQTPPGLSCLLVDAQDKPIAGPNTTGELLVGGIQVMSEYLGDAARTAQSLFRHGGETYYRTGDLGFRSAEGDYFITGRKDDTLKRRGYRINLLDIDSYIQRLDAVQDCATIAIPDTEKDHILVTYVIPRTEQPENVLREKIARVLVDYQVPDHIIYMNQFPTNNSGKVSKDALTKTFLAGAAKAS